MKSSDADRVKEVYQVAHGMLPSDIIPRDRVTVGMFLGRIVDPAMSGEARYSFRVVMFTCMEGSTELTRRLCDARAMKLVREHDSIIRAALKACLGTEVNHTGDGIMASFGSVTESRGGS